MASYRTCDGVRRREFLQAGMLGGMGLALSDLLRSQARADQILDGRHAPAKGAIFISLAGGPSHMDTFDLKPNASAEFRGEFNPIQTNAPGVEISEHLPNLAKEADKFTIMRGVTHTLAAHEFGAQYMNTGNRPISSLQFPGYGSVVSRELEGAPDLPSFIAIPDTVQSPGYLGIRYSALKTNATPQFDKPFTVRGITLGGGLTVPDVERRQNLLRDLDTTFAQVEKESDLLSGLDQFSDKAHRIITSEKTRKAFDILQESAEVRADFGKSNFGQSCLLAVRLIEAGVRFVTVTLGGWDTHADNFKRLKTKNLPELDEGLAALFRNLQIRGLLAETQVMVTGEFGRTPKINPKVGRDHWPRAMFVLLGGGGIAGGRVIGESDENGMGPKDRKITPEDLAASFYKNLGIDHAKEYQTSIGRPVMVVRDGSPIPELLG